MMTVYKTRRRPTRTPLWRGGKNAATMRGDDAPPAHVAEAVRLMGARLSARAAAKRAKRLRNDPRVRYTR